jgi:hypothetical protein
VSWLDNVFSQPTSLQVYDVLDRAFNSLPGANWPLSDGYTPELAVKIIEVYHDLVANKKFALPNTNENLKKLTAQIRATLGLNNKPPGIRLAPTNILMALNAYITPVNRELYDWVFPAQLEQEEDGGNGVVKVTSNIKWIMFFGLASLVILQTGILKKVSPN